MRRSRSPTANDSSTTAVSSEEGPAWREATSRIPHFYTVLGVEPSATEKQIQQAYKKLAIIYHPDRQHQVSDEQKRQNERDGVDPKQKFQDIQKAYDVLNDAKQRSEYDAKHGLNLSLRVGALMNGLKSRPIPQQQQQQSLFVPVPVDHCENIDGVKNVDDDDDDYVPGNHAQNGSNSISPAGQQNQQQQNHHQQQQQQSVHVEVDAEWAELLAAESASGK